MTSYKILISNLIGVFDFVVLAEDVQDGEDLSVVGHEGLTDQTSASAVDLGRVCDYKKLQDV